jgi:uncharacterized protein (TIGR02145 family)
MKRGLFLVIFFCALQANAQTYLISFAGSGESATVGSVKVENLMSGAALTLNGGDILRLNVATGVNSIEDNKSAIIKIYPNPAADYATFEICPPVAGDATIIVSEMTGKPIARIQSYLEDYRQEFRLSGLSSGFYLISVEGDSYRYSGKLLCTNKTEGIVRIEKIRINQAVAYKTSKNESKGAQVAVDMAYTAGDRLKFTGISGNFSTVKTDIPASDETITFYFVACVDGDNNNYPVVIADHWVWMAKNLKTTKYHDGTPISYVSDNSLWHSLLSDAYCWYFNDPDSYKDTYGALYNRYAVNTNEICPVGWGVPPRQEWDRLVDFVGGSGIASGRLKSSTGWNGGNGIDEFGFSALPGGFRDSHLNIDDGIGTIVYYWTISTYLGNASQYYRRLSSGDDLFQEILRDDVTDGFSVRCFRFAQVND